MQIDPIFSFTAVPHLAAEKLLALGLTEGIHRAHPGQHTASRKFYFENFFFEILWVRDEAEITGPARRSTGLWQRAGYAPI